jgi:hypothetical protein
MLQAIKAKFLTTQTTTTRATAKKQLGQKQKRARAPHD